MRTTATPNSEPKTEQSDWVKLVRDSVDPLHFGIVQIVVHNGKVVQIEKTEKLRLDQNHSAASAHQATGR